MILSETCAHLYLKWINFRDFRVFWPFSRNFVHAKILGTADSRNFVHAKFLEILITKSRKNYFRHFFLNCLKEHAKMYFIYFTYNGLFQKKSVQGGVTIWFFLTFTPRIFRIFTPGQRDFQPRTQFFSPPGHGKITPWTQNFTPGQRF